jgi:hypothetical protein
MKEAIVLMDSIPKLHVYEENARKYADTLAGDGFVEWGYHLNYADKSRVAINNGATTYDKYVYISQDIPNIRNAISIGVNDSGHANIVKNSKTI